MSTDLKENKTSEDEYSYSPRSRGTKKKVITEKKPISKKKIALLCTPIAIILLLIIFLLTYVATSSSTHILNNVYVANLNLGNKTVDEAVSEISSLITPETQISLTSAGNTTVITASDFGLSVDAEKTAQKALYLTNTGNIFVDAYYAGKLLFTKHTIGLELNYDTELLDSLLFDFGTTFNGVSTEPKFEYGNNTMTIIPGTAGQNHDTTTARNQLITALSNGQTDSVEVYLDYSEPKSLDLDETYKKITSPTTDAQYVKNENGRITVTEHSVGVEIDKQTLKSALEKFNTGETVTVNAVISMPSKTKKILEEKLFSSTIGTYSSSYATSSANRAFNVERAANSINGKILMPGEEFSYNDAVGNPSLANGYKIASVFQNGKSVQGAGGGICQVSSTLYNSVLLADLNITERHNHSLTVGYVPKGQDATVSYNAVDFRFKNSTEYPVKISAVYSNRRLTVSLIGTQYVPKREVVISSSVISTIPPGENITEDPTLPAGTRNVVSSGSNGYVVDTYKTVYENGVKKSSAKITTSRYKATASEVVVGTSATELPVSGEVTPTTDPVITESPNPPADTETQPTVSASPVPEQTPENSPSVETTPEPVTTEEPIRPMPNTSEE